MSPLDDRLEHFIRHMPKVELHLHLEGTIRPATLLDLARRHGVALPVRDVDEIVEWYRFRNFRHFVDIWLAINECLRDGDDFARITRELGETAAAQHVRYAQVTFTPATYEKYKRMPYGEIWRGIRAGADWVEQTLGVRFQFSVDIARNRHPGTDGSVESTVEWAIANRNAGIVALGLGGMEAGNPPELFVEIFRHAKRHGLYSWPHAGETVGPESMWGAIRALGADRIAHGIRAIEDPELLAYLAAHRIACDVCPTSNVCLGVCPSMEAHPIRQLLNAGVPVTLASDDPPLFHTTLTDEFLALARTHAFTASELATLVRTGVAASFLPASEKEALRARVDAELTAAASDADVSLHADT